MRTSPDAGRSGGWIRFLAGLALLLGFAFLLSRGVAPPGPLGEVVRHNLLHGIDATPLFYTEVEDSMAFDYSRLFIEPGLDPKSENSITPSMTRSDR
jgi:hypothetical protein